MTSLLPVSDSLARNRELRQYTFPTHGHPLAVEIDRVIPQRVRDFSRWQSSRQGVVRVRLA